MRFARGLSGLMLAAAAVGLAACASGKTTPDLAPVTTAPVAPAPGPLPVGNALTAAQITNALAERKFTYAAPSMKGTVTFYKDGTFEYDQAGRGTGTGIWQAADGKLCQARNPTSWLPKGTPSTCQPITSDGMRLTAGPVQFTPL
ncbi:MAG: hypothetical protein IOC82_07765 [Aestuariivirga sp.]|uniref:hypothetical protein n=1 Tax=Aestuariivirga sp. TaxID=2650926 RepID=UPI0025C00669|nr:hypothetical protein [Aestuariivirga sp.]MCA3560907.1 hypothetical protein [Aestuariivirga sp.]